MNPLELACRAKQMEVRILFYLETYFLAYFLTYLMRPVLCRATVM